MWRFIIGVDMEDIYFTDQNRSQMEDRIVALAESVLVEDSDWPHSQQLDEFIHAWYDLARFYAAHSDTIIGVEAVCEYVDFARLLRKLMGDSAMDAELRQQAEDQMFALEGGMEKVIFEAVSNLNNLDGDT